MRASVKSSDLDDVELNHLHGARIDQSGKLVFPGLGLEAGDGNARTPGKLGTTFHVFGLGRLLEPADVQGLDGICIAHRHARGERGIGIDHEIARSRALLAPS